MIESQELRTIGGFAEIDSDAVEDLARACREVRYSRGQRVVPMIRPPRQIEFLLAGLVKLVGVSLEGVERILYVYRPGEILGSRALLESSPEAGYECVAMHATRTAAISRADFFAIAERHPELLVAVTRQFSRRLSILTNRMLSAMSDDVSVRLGQLLMDFAAYGREDGDGFVPLDHPLTHETMAQIIGASRPHTSTVLRDLESIGVVRRRSDRGLLVRPTALARLVRGSAA